MDSPLEYFEKTFCTKCKNKKCVKKSSGIYTTTVDYSGKIFCALSALILLEFNRTLLKEFMKHE